MSLELVTAPAVEPLTLDVVKAHLKLGELDVEDSLIQNIYIGSARRDAEHATQRALITQTWRLRLCRFPSGGPLYVPKPPLQSITSIAYVDGDGQTQTWDAAEYAVDTYSEPGRVYPAYGYSWPTSRGDPNSVIVTFVAGYGASGADVPEDIRNALLLIIGDRYAQREDTQILSGGEREMEQLPRASQWLLCPYAIPVF